MSRLERQSFLGPGSDTILERATLGIVGLGGGGSHIVQQAAHMGVGGYVLADHDRIDDTNTNRLVGGTLIDVENEEPKISIAVRTIRGLQPNARIEKAQDSWHTATKILRGCDVIIGAVDSFKERDQLERFAHRYLIPYIDIGMDVTPRKAGGFLISGQVILSSPGGPCLRCCHLITDERLTLEAGLYGAAGVRPQVVWPNGILASSAIGLFTQLVTPWFPNPPSFMYLEYDGNKGTLSPSGWVEGLHGKTCKHHPIDETGDPLFDIRNLLNPE